MATDGFQERFELTMELSELAEQMLREKLRRSEPRLTPASIEVQITDWYQRRRGAEQGDAEGVPVPLPRAGRK